MSRPVLLILICTASINAQGYLDCRKLPDRDRRKIDLIVSTDRREIVLRFCLMTAAKDRGDTVTLANHLAWIIESYHEHGFLVPVLEFAAFSKESDPASYDRIRDKWNAAVKRSPHRPELLADAAQFLMVSDRKTAIEYLREAAAQPKPTLYRKLLGRAYGMEVAGLVSSDGKGHWAFEKQEAQEARRVLDASEDAVLLYAAGGALAAAASRDTALADYQERLLAKAAALDPKLFHPAPPPTRIRAATNVQMSTVIHQPHPIYPPKALSRRLEGTVRFEAVIGHSGLVTNLFVLSGDPIFIEAATACAVRCLFRTALVDGEPVEFITPVEVQFRLPRKKTAE